MFNYLKNNFLSSFSFWSCVGFFFFFNVEVFLNVFFSPPTETERRNKFKPQIILVNAGKKAKKKKQQKKKPTLHSTAVFYASKSTPTPAWFVI